MSLYDDVTAVTCSAALPTIGSKIRPTNSLLMLPVEVRPSIESTRNSAVTATNWGRKDRSAVNHDCMGKR